MQFALQYYEFKHIIMENTTGYESSSDAREYRKQNDQRSKKTRGKLHQWLCKISCIKGSTESGEKREIKVIVKEIISGE